MNSELSLKEQAEKMTSDRRVTRPAFPALACADTMAGDTDRLSLLLPEGHRLTLRRRAMSLPLLEISALLAVVLLCLPA